MARIATIGEPSAAPDPSYVVGLRAALVAALDYGLSALALPSRPSEPVPVELLSQARLAARNGVSLEAVLRRYAAGHGLLADSLLEEAAAAGVGAAALRDPLRALSYRYDCVVAAVSEEYERESLARPQGRERRRQALLGRLLAGEPLDASELGYELDAHHVAIVASGAAVLEALEALRPRLDRRLLLVAPEQQSAWAWLGGRRPLREEELRLIDSHAWPAGSAVARGTPGNGLNGWRLSHRQAAAALPVAQRGPATFVRYADVALLASALADDLLVTSLRRSYLKPLGEDRNGAARRTLRAYFAASGNVSSAAAALGVNRATVRSRLKTVEERLGRSLDAVSAEIEVALRLDELERRSKARLEEEFG